MQVQLMFDLQHELDGVGDLVFGLMPPTRANILRAILADESPAFGQVFIYRCSLAKHFCNGLRAFGCAFDFFDGGHFTSAPHPEHPLPGTGGSHASSVSIVHSVFGPSRLAVNDTMS